MRCATASEFKKKGRRCAPLQVAPREGTRLRAIYDLLQSNKGKPVQFQQKGMHGADVRSLTDFYGLDIRRLQNGSPRTGLVSMYVLAGEWFGRVYIDYIAERLQ